MEIVDGRKFEFETVKSTVAVSIDIRDTATAHSRIDLVGVARAKVDNPASAKLERADIASSVISRVSIKIGGGASGDSIQVDSVGARIDLSRRN